jgi:hypothetical protein
MMKKTIQTRSLQGLQEDYGLWIDCVKKKLEAQVAKPSTSFIGDATKIAHEFEEYNIHNTTAQTYLLGNNRPLSYHKRPYPRRKHL